MVIWTRYDALGLMQQLGFIPCMVRFEDNLHNADNHVTSLNSGKTYSEGYLLNFIIQELTSFPVVIELPFKGFHI